MAADDVAKALMAMDDETLRSAVASGDLAGLGEVELTADEQALVRAAASDDPDVTGFAVVCDGLVSRGIVVCNGLASRGEVVCNGFTGGARGLGWAGSYATQGISQPALASTFGNWFGVKQAQGGW